jgi:ankyrin repeat protein
MTLDHLGRTPLHYAAMDNDVEHVAQLLADGADVVASDLDGLTPLHMACQHGAVDAARSLLDGGATVDSLNVYGNSPLFVAVFNSGGRGDLIMLLRERGADPFRSNNAGQTPIGLARLVANYDVAQYFADLPADPREKRHRPRPG